MSADLTKLVRARDMNGFQMMAVAVCLAINMLDGFDVLVVAFTGPRIAEEWGVAPQNLGLLFSAGLLGMGLGSVFLAPLADRVGRRAIVLMSLMVITVGMLSSSLANNLTALAALRVFTGLGIGSMLASLNTIVAECVSDKRRDLAISLLTIGYPIGALIGGVISVYLIGEFGWRGPFVFGGAMSAVLIPAVLFHVPESLDFLLAQRPNNALERINKLLGKFGADPIDELPELLKEHKEHASLMSVFNKTLLPGTIRICSAFFMVFLTFYFLLNWTPKILVDQGLSEAVGISGSLIINAAGIIGGTALGYLASIYTLRTMASIYLVMSFAAIVLFGFMPTHLVGLMVVAFIIGFFMFGCMASLYAIAPLIYPATVRNTGMGMAIGIGRIGAVAGPAIAGSLIAAGWEQPYYYLALALPILAAVAIIRSIDVLKQERPTV